MVGEIKKKAESKPGGLQIVLDLCSEHVIQFGDGLQFDDDAAVADEVRFVVQSKLSSFVLNLELRLLDERDLLDLKLNRQTLVVNGLQEPCSQLFVNLETGTKDLVGLLFEQECQCSAP